MSGPFLLPQLIYLRLQIVDFCLILPLNRIDLSFLIIAQTKLGPVWRKPPLAFWLRIITEQQASPNQSHSQHPTQYESHSAHGATPKRRRKWPARRATKSPLGCLFSVRRNSTSMN